MKKALITGITGQDGSFLAEFLLEKGYEVHGIVRRASISNTARIDHLIEKNAITLHDGDLNDASSLQRVIALVKPDEIYNLAAQSHVQVSFDVPANAGDVDAASTRPPPASSMARCRPGPRARPRPSIPTAPTPWRSSTASGS